MKASVEDEWFYLVTISVRKPPADDLPVVFRTFAVAFSYLAAWSIDPAIHSTTHRYSKPERPRVLSARSVCSPSMEELGHEWSFDVTNSLTRRILIRLRNLKAQKE